MTDTQFYALVQLITLMHMHLTEMHAHPNDRPRSKAIQREMSEAIEEARQVLVDATELSEEDQQELSTIAHGGSLGQDRG